MSFINKPAEKTQNTMLSNYSETHLPGILSLEVKEITLQLGLIKKTVSEKITPLMGAIFIVSK